VITVWKKLAQQAEMYVDVDSKPWPRWMGAEECEAAYAKFAELIVRECCLALWTEECHTSDLAFDEVKRNATRIKEHFGIDPNEITEDMLARSIKWMEQQLEDKKHFGVKE
jgi:hypothetical protein